MNSGYERYVNIIIIIIIIIIILFIDDSLWVNTVSDGLEIAG